MAFLILQAIVEELSNAGTDVDPDFRLWLSSKPDRAFPVPILQRGLKVNKVEYFTVFVLFVLYFLFLPSWTSDGRRLCSIFPWLANVEDKDLLFSLFGHTSTVLCTLHAIYVHRK